MKSWNYRRFMQSWRAGIGLVEVVKNQHSMLVAKPGDTKMLPARPFGPCRLNCADDNHFSRVCPSSYSNRSGILNIDIGAGTAHEVATP